MIAVTPQLRGAEKRRMAEEEPDCRLVRVLSRLPAGQHTGSHKGAFQEPADRSVAWGQPADFRRLVAGKTARVEAGAPRKKAFFCTFDGCTKTYLSASGLRVHRRWHTGKGLHVCSMPGCTKRYTTATNLQLHLWRHAGKKPWVCPAEGCSQRFRHKGQLKDHRLVHQRGRPWVCPLEHCRKGFLRKSSPAYPCQLSHRNAAFCVSF